MATALRKMGRSEREVQQLFDSIDEVHSNMSSTDDVFVVSHAKQASTHVAGTETHLPESSWIWQPLFLISSRFLHGGRLGGREGEGCELGRGNCEMRLEKNGGAASDFLCVSVAEVATSLVRVSIGFA